MRSSKKPGQFEAWNNYCFLLALATIACLPMVMPEYWRFFSITVVCSALPFMILVENRKHVVRYQGYLIYLVTPLCLLITLRFILHCDRLKLILGPFMSSPLLVLGKGILHLLR